MRETENGIPDAAKRQMDAQTEMEALAAELRDIISAQPPKDLLGYIYSMRNLRAVHAETDEDGEEKSITREAMNSDQFLLEYVHAVLAATPSFDNKVFDEAAVARLHYVGDRLRHAAMLYAMATSAPNKDGAFGPQTGTVEFLAKSSWIIMRGSRYPVLEGEFYSYVLGPHDDVLRDVYGVSSGEIAAGFQAIADVVSNGQSLAAETLDRHIQAAQAFAEEQEQSFESIVETLIADRAYEMTEAALAADDMLRGGICNVSRHSKLPNALLADLAFRRGEDVEFFAEGALAGTPLRTLPARKKPLIELDGEYYAPDPCFIRDSGYRALLFNLLKRRSDYRKQFEVRQKFLTENAFADILKGQLRGARSFSEVYYKDIQTNEWVENDTLILLDDVLILVEAKSGANATIASPASDFERHARSVQDLVVKAYQQCRRFFKYIASSDEVPLFSLEAGKYIEVARIRYADYRLLLPIGLTVESFSPFSAMCKELPEVLPLLGQHPFFSMSIDDLFVLRRFLPTAGELGDYLEVRQAVAGMRGANLFDEIDHLGAYFQKNRFDMDIADQQATGKASRLIWDGFSEIVDNHFAGEDWDQRPVPQQEYPAEVARLLDALDRTRQPGWLKAESIIRTYGNEGRDNLAKTLIACRETLHKHESRYFYFVGKPGLFVWLQRSQTEPDLARVRDKAISNALAMGSVDVVAVIAWADTNGEYLRGMHVAVTLPKAHTDKNSHLYDDAERMRNPRRWITFSEPPKGKIGRNQPCWCGSGIKFKRCHGR